MALSPSGDFALGLWSYIVISPQKGLKVGGLYVMAAGTLFYIARGWLERRRLAA